MKRIFHASNKRWSKPVRVFQQACLRVECIPFFEFYAVIARIMSNGGLDS